MGVSVAKRSKLEGAGITAHAAEDASAAQHSDNLLNVTWKQST